MSKASDILDNVSKVIVGKRNVSELVLTSIIAGGHVLLEDVPGTGKTMMAKAFAKSIDGQFSRIQFTPDLLPSDITGVHVFNQKEGEFVFRRGPVFANVILADEINRATPRTQSALLECMEEHQVTVDGEYSKLEEPFVVIATQNPIETAGTYQLPEAQLDRFLLKETVTYPSARDEMEILNRVEAGVFSDVKSVASVDDVVYLQKLCKRIYIDPAIKKYIVDIVQATRMTDKILAPELAQYVAMGASTRAAIAFMEVAKAIALINGRRYCVPDDVKALRYSVLRHRIMLTFAAVAEDVKIEKIIDAIIGSVKTP